MSWHKVLLPVAQSNALRAWETALWILWGTMENKGRPSRSSQVLLCGMVSWPHASTPELCLVSLNLISWVSLNSLAYSAFCQTLGPALAFVVTVVGCRRKDIRSSAMITHHLTLESFGHAIQPAVTSVHALYPRLKALSRIPVVQVLDLFWLWILLMSYVTSSKKPSFILF